MGQLTADFLRKMANKAERKTENKIKEPDGCAGKVGFTTVVAAQKAAQISSRKWNNKLKPYHCKECHLWHFGNISPKRKEK